MKKTIALLLAAILLLSFAACGQTAQPAEPTATEVPAEAPAEVESSAEPDNSNVDYSLRVAQMGTSIKAAMVVLANEMGYYAEEGLDVTFKPINNLNDGITAILGGSLDILPIGVIPTCTFVAQGADLTVIGGTILTPILLKLVFKGQSEDLISSGLADRYEKPEQLDVASLDLLESDEKLLHEEHNTKKNK